MKAPALILLVGTAAASADTINFDDVRNGKLLPDWLGTQNGSGAAKWAVENVDDAPSKPKVLKQSGVATFPVCIKKGTNIKDGFVEVKFKPVAGKEDQAGGVIWRCKDESFEGPGKVGLWTKADSLTLFDDFSYDEK